MRNELSFSLHGKVKLNNIAVATELISSVLILCNVFVQPSRVKISNVHYINIRGTSSSAVAVDFRCSPQFPCDNVHLYNVDLKHIGRGPATATCSNARVGLGGVVNPRVTCH